MKEREILIKDSPLRNFDNLGNILKVFTKYNGSPQEIRGKEIVFHNVDGKVPHLTYLDYLKIAYNTDYGIIIKPDFIWFTILNEITHIINKDPEKFRKSLSKNKDKIEITGNGTSMVELPVDQMLELVLEHLPCKLTKEDIIPPFSTSDDDSRLAFAVSFLDAVSPYYGYSYYGCMYNKIKILGEPEDYHLMEKAFNNIFKKIKGLSSDYSNQINNILGRIIDNFYFDEFWKHILWTEHGYMMDNVDGWILNLYVDKTNTHNTQISKIEYTEKILNIDYIMVSGLFSSKIEDGYMIPSFQKIIVKKNSEDKESALKDEKNTDWESRLRDEKNTDWESRLKDGKFDDWKYRELFGIASNSIYEYIIDKSENNI